MTREYTHVKHLEPIVFEMKAQGKSHAEIAAAFKLSKQQIKELVKRHNRRERELQSKMPAKRIGRPRKHTIDSWRELEAENSRLKMENDLLRDFLSTIERM
jgi:orotate phosphoribosyltransferase-like protein